MVSTRDGRPFSIGGVTVRDGAIVEMDSLLDPERLAQLDLTVVNAPRRAGVWATARRSSGKPNPIAVRIDPT